MICPVIDLETDFGVFKCFAVKEANKEHLVLYKGIIKGQECLVRIHSECLTGDLFKSKRCDCGEQLNMALERIAKENGILIYLRQEGRDVGLFNKIKAYDLQDKGFDTVEANIALGLPIDGRKYNVAAEVLKSLSPSKIMLMTNNPKKIEAIRLLLPIPIKRISLHSNIISKLSAHYLFTKRTKMNHLTEC